MLGATACTQFNVPLRCPAIEFVPLRLGHLVQHRGADDAGIVDEDVDPAEALAGRCDHRLHLIAARHVAPDSERGHVATESRRGSLRPLARWIHDRQMGAFTCKSPGYGGTDAPAQRLGRSPFCQPAASERPVRLWPCTRHPRHKRLGEALRLRAGPPALASLRG